MLAETPENCEIIVKVHSKLESGASIRLGLYRDKDNYVSLIRTRGPGNHHLIFSKSLRGEVSEIKKRIKKLPEEVYLKITQSNLEYTGYYSVNRETWSEIGQQFFKDLNGRASLAVYNNKPKTPEAAVQFDYFEIKMVE